MKTFIQFISEQSTDSSQSPLWWHGSPSGDLRGGPYGLHLGTKKSATDALNARVGYPVEGEWDGTREYGSTKLAGQRTMKSRGLRPTGHNYHAPEHDYYAHEHPKGFPRFMSSSVNVLPTHKPEVKSYHLTGSMSNRPDNPHSDTKANGFMMRQLYQGNAKKGYYYKNKYEDEGSVSVVVPGPDHIRKVK